MFDLHPMTTADVLSALTVLVLIGGFYFSWSTLNATQKSLEDAHDTLKTAQASLEIAATSAKAAVTSATAAEQNTTIALTNAQAQLFNEMIVQGREFNWNLLNGTPFTPAEKARKINGMLLAYYGACFELRNILPMPAVVTRIMDEELKTMIKKPEVKEIWRDVKNMYTKEFIKHVDVDMTGV